MSSASLHPLARQAIVLSRRTDCYGWAFGLTKYLSYRDPSGCVRWTLNFVMPHVQLTGEYAEVAHRSVGFLEDMLAEPNRASLHEIDQFAWLPWSHRWAIKGAGPLARLVWAAMGARLLARSGEPKTCELPDLFHGEAGPRTVAEKVVCDQCATAIHMLGDDTPAIPMETAARFTKRVCHNTPLIHCTIMRRLEWAWGGIEFEVAVLQDTEGAFHLQYHDRLGEKPLISGPFSTMKEVDERLDLFKTKLCGEVEWDCLFIDMTEEDGPQALVPCIEEFEEKAQESNEDEDLVLIEVGWHW